MTVPVRHRHRDSSSHWPRATRVRRRGRRGRAQRPRRRHHPRRRRSPVVVEAKDDPGGGTRTDEVTLPGFLHDICSAIHPLGAVSPAFRDLPLEDLGLSWADPRCRPPTPSTTAAPGAPALGRGDGRGPRRPEGLASPGRSGGDDGTRSPSTSSGRWSGSPATRSPSPASGFGRSRRPRRSATGSDHPQAKALWGGIAAHAIHLSQAAHHRRRARPRRRRPRERLARRRGRLPAIADALIAHLEHLGGKVECGRHARSMDDSRGPGLPLRHDASAAARHRRAEDRRPCPAPPGALPLRAAARSRSTTPCGPVPWARPGCRRAGTVHVGGTLEEVAAAEAAVHRGEHPERPYVLVAQQSVIDPTRAPDGKHALWAYCHVPQRVDGRHDDRIEAQIERFAPGFRRRVLARTDDDPAGLEAYNPNYLGGDIASGATDGLQMSPARPSRRAPTDSGRPACGSARPRRRQAAASTACAAPRARVALRELRF